MQRHGASGLSGDGGMIGGAQQTTTDLRLQ